MSKATNPTHDGAMIVEEWKTLVLACMKANNFNRFSKDVVKRVGEVPSLDDLNRWLAP